MEIQIAKWGNSLGIRIPKAFADEIMLSEGSFAEIYPQKGKLVIEPINKYSLDSLLSEINKNNLHNTVDEGAAVGSEIIE